MGFNLGPEKILVVLVFALIFLGPDKLPEAARKLGEWMGHARRMSGGFESELRQAIDQPLRTFQRELAIGEQRAANSHDRAAGSTTPDSTVADGAEQVAPGTAGAPAAGAATTDTTTAETPDAAHTTPAGQRVTHHAPSAPQSALPSWVFPDGASSADRPGFH